MASEWFVKSQGQELGPLSSGQLKAMAADGRLTLGDLVRLGHDGRWVSATYVKGLTIHATPLPNAGPPPHVAATIYPGQSLRMHVDQARKARLRAYHELRKDIQEHYNIEQVVLAGGYGYRQVLELVQNGADAILEGHEEGRPHAGGNRIDVILRDSCLYVANTGAPLTKEGVDSLLMSHSSPKRGNEIGRFGLGFKSLLGLRGKIDLFTRSSGAIRFDPERCRRELQEQFGVSDAPGLRLAWPLDDATGTGDPVLATLRWAETVVRVEIRAAEFSEYLRREIREFPPEFLLFLQVPAILRLDDGVEPSRELRIEREGGECVLIAGEEQTHWRVVRHEVTITDERALADATHIHARKSVPLAWAIPSGVKREQAGRFWAFFPTNTPTFMHGILNAPWKLNSDRNAIIRGEWNTALMGEAAHLVAETLPSLSTKEDPGRVLDAFPRQIDTSDDVANPLVQTLWKVLEAAPVVPDATGTIRRARELWRHPLDKVELAKHWQALTDSNNLTSLVHHSCLERQRGSRLNALAERLAKGLAGEPLCPNLRRQDVGSWFAAVASVDLTRAVEVLKLTAAYANGSTSAEWNRVGPLLAIIPTYDGQLLTAEKVVFAPEGTEIPDGRHPIAAALCDHGEAKRILENVLKVKPVDEELWRSVLSTSLHSAPYHAQGPEFGWKVFWRNLRGAPPAVRQQFVMQYRDSICVRRRDGKWVAVDAVLLPGALVGPDDASANRNMLVDSEVHGSDETVLRQVGVVDFPDGTVSPFDCAEGINDLYDWLEECRKLYRRELSPNHNPQRDYLLPSSLTGEVKGSATFKA